jgi:peptidoglycan DL-endopeptidase CwlO
VQTRRSGGTALIGRFRRRGAAISLGVIAAGAMVISVGGAAGAASQPTLGQVQAKLSKLNKQAQVLDEQFDQVLQTLESAKQQLVLVDEEETRYLARFNLIRKQVGEIAAQAYMDGTLNSPEVLLTSNNPQEILNQSSMLEELASSNSSEISAFLSAARQLNAAVATARRTKDAEAAIAANLVTKKKALEKAIAQQTALLNQLTPAEQEATGPGTGGPPIGGSDPLPDVSQGEKAVAFAYAQLGCPYLFGGTGPCHTGFDCSGLTQAAWASAGVAIPRTSFEQADLPSVPEADLEPGDILEFDGDGHVGLYVGSGMLIDAPHTGAFVEKVAFSGWYQENFDGAVRP